MPRQLRFEYAGAYYSGSKPRKAALALELWRQTTVSQSWIAVHLHMKSAAKREPNPAPP